MSEWLPIKTAPTDCLHFLDPVLLKRETVWSPEDTDEVYTTVRYVCVGYLMPGGWAMSIKGAAGLTGTTEAMLTLEKPTHWMQLPANSGKFSERRKNMS